MCVREIENERMREEERERVENKFTTIESSHLDG